MIKLIVFDFDGTLVDSKSKIYGIICREVAKLGYTTSKAFESNMGLLPLEKDLRALGLNGELKKVLEKINEEIALKVEGFRKQPGFNSLRSLNVRKMILSNNTKKSISIFVKKNARGVFVKVYGEGDFRSKYDGMKRIIKNNKLRPEEVLFVGDRASDIDAGKKVGCHTVAIYNKNSWGTKKEVLGSKPDFIISSLSELKKVLVVLDSFKLARV